MYEYTIKDKDYGSIEVKFNINEEGSVEDERYFLSLKKEKALIGGIMDITDTINLLIQHRWIDFDKLQCDLIAFANSENLFREEQNRDVFGDIGKALRP